MVTAILTTLLAICAPFLDAIAGYGLNGGRPGCEGVFPRRVNEWLFCKFDERGRSRSHFLRNVLSRVMITLGDQQVLTGIAILVSGYARAADLDSDEVRQLDHWHYRLIENHFYLVIYLACLSSSSHLAAIVTSKAHLRENRVPAFLRLALIVIFACLLTVTICLAVPFGPPTIVYLSLLQDIKLQEGQCQRWKQSYGTDCNVKSVKFLLALFYIAVAIAILYPYWIAIVNTFEDWNDRLKGHIKRLWRKDSKWLPMHWIRISVHGLERIIPKGHRASTRQWFKDAFWFLILGNTGRAFYLQLIFFAISMFYVLLQRIANKPDKSDPNTCDLSAGGTKWGFGQILPLILLAVPFIAALVSFFGKRSCSSVIVSAMTNLFS